ncbi:membrane protein insertion efficiency factor YidD [bacterium]|nr:membrane protein insertion efficiency factor YidD [bacterium]MBU1073485.1 membrane protein insertion efficiency factor YidD [bacterium]MBU1674874.1 membrane protein insertion efficiency factor YidD [bacterium]
MWRLPYLLVRLYQRLFSPLLPAMCRFDPTCSEYAAGSLRTHGLLRGTVLSLRRIVRCHPFNPGGNDPVPTSPGHTQHPYVGDDSHG